MVCIYCNSRLFVTSVWFCKKNNYQYSYICFCVNPICDQYLVKFRKHCKYESEIETCRNFELTHQRNGNCI